ncbi:MAG: AAA family ATPase [Candidatus Cybelea sp.]
MEADVVLYDWPPSMGILTASALLAASAVLVPVTATSEGLDGSRSFAPIWNVSRSATNVPCRWASSSRSTTYVLELRAKRTPRLRSSSVWPATTILAGRSG